MTISITVTGNVATDVRSIATATGRQVAVFRLAVPDRRWIKGKGWVDGDPSFISVTTFSQVATNVATSIAKGQPVIVKSAQRVSTADSFACPFCPTVCHDWDSLQTHMSIKHSHK